MGKNNKYSSRFAIGLGLKDRNVPEDVALHGEQEAVRVRAHAGRGRAARARRQLRLPHGVHHPRLLRPPQLQPHPDRRTHRLQILWHRHAHR